MLLISSAKVGKSCGLSTFGIKQHNFGDSELSIETYIQMEGEEITELELSIDELLDVALEIN